MYLGAESLESAPKTLIHTSSYYYQNTHIPNKTIYIKLWKEEPSSPENKADITEIITIEK